MRLLVYVPILIMFLKVTVLFKARPRGMLKIDNVAHVFQRFLDKERTVPFGWTGLVYI